MAFVEVFNTGEGVMETISERKAASSIAAKVPLGRDSQPGPAAEISHRQFKTKARFPLLLSHLPMQTGQVLRGSAAC